MLAILTDAPFDDPGWVFESKWDGFRMVAGIENGRVTLYSRNGKIVSESYRQVAQAGKVKGSAVLDGELVALDENGISRFQLLQNALRAQAVRRYYLFDLTFLDGKDLRQLPCSRARRNSVEFCRKTLSSPSARTDPNGGSSTSGSRKSTGSRASWPSLLWFSAMRAPLLVIDGDSFAHRAFHALPKTIRRRGNKGGGAILGFANYLLRFCESEKPRAVLAAWDTLDAPTDRHDVLPGYQSGREFDDELIDQLEVLPEFVTACGFACAKAAGYEADDFLAAAVAREERRGGTAIVATGDRDAYQLASDRTTILQPVRAGELARIGPAEVRARYDVDPKRGAGLHRRARRQLRPHTGPRGHGAAGRCQRAAQVRLARECHQGRTLRAPS